LLFVPTASSDSKSYYEVVKKHFGKRLGCKTDVLYLIKGKLTKKQIEEKVFNSDIIYVGGGNTAKLMKVWRKKGLDKILKKAGEKGIVLSGISAGAICWCKYGLSDSRRFNNPNADFIRVSGMNLVNVTYCPHYDFEPRRKLGLKKLMQKSSGVAIALDNCSAIEIIDDKYSILKSKTKANVYRVLWNKGKFHQEIIKQRKEFRPLSEILSK